MATPTRPANPAGFVFGLVYTAAFVFAAWMTDDWSSMTRRGLPIGLLLVIGIASGIYLMWRGWTRKEPERPRDEEPVSRRRVVIGSVVLVTAVAVIVTLLVLAELAEGSR